MTKFIIEGNTYELVQSRFTFGEAKAIEKVTGLPIQSILNDADSQGRADVLQAFFWVSMKRTDPTLTFDDLEDMDMASIEVVEDEPEPDPTQPAEPVVAPVPAAESPAPVVTTSALYV